MDGVFKEVIVLSDSDIRECMEQEAVILRAVFEEFAMTHGNRPDEAACRDLVAEMNGFSSWSALMKLAEGMPFVGRLQQQAGRLHAVVDGLMLKSGPHPRWRDCLDLVAQSYGYENWHEAMVRHLRQAARHQPGEGLHDAEGGLRGLMVVITPSPYAKEGEYGHARSGRFSTERPILSCSTVESARFAWADEKAYARANCLFADQDVFDEFANPAAAEVMCRSLVRMVPCFLPAHAVLADAMVRQGRLKEGLDWFFRAFDAAVKSLPKNFDGWISPHFEENRTFHEFVWKGLVMTYSESEDARRHIAAALIAEQMIEWWPLDGCRFYSLRSKARFDKWEAAREAADEMGIWSALSEGA